MLEDNNERLSPYEARLIVQRAQEAAREESCDM